MGGSGGGGFSVQDLTRLTEAAEARLKELAADSALVVFACELEDRRSLESHLKRSQVFDKRHCVVVDSSNPEEAWAAIAKAPIIVLFTSSTKDTTFLDQLSDQALAARKQVIHAKATSNSQFLLRLQLIGGRRLFGRSLKRNSLDESGQRP